MPRKILRRCALCGNFHASFLVPELPAGKGYLCAACWKAWMARQAPSTLADFHQPAGKAASPATTGQNDTDPQP